MTKFTCLALKKPYVYMSKVNCRVLSSVYEGLPNVLIEALICGCSVVSTDCPSGPQEILNGGKYGHLVLVSDVNGLAESIEKVIRGDERRPPREWVEQFEVDHITNQYLKVFLKVYENR